MTPYVLTLIVGWLLGAGSAYFFGRAARAHLEAQLNLARNDARRAARARSSPLEEWRTLGLRPFVRRNYG